MIVAPEGGGESRGVVGLKREGVPGDGRAESGKRGSILGVVDGLVVALTPAVGIGTSEHSSSSF